MNSITNGLMMLKILVASVLILIGAAGCSSSPSETPEKFVMTFIQKHIPMIDRSVADFYVKEERAGVIDRVQQFIASKKEKGTLASLKTAIYDFSKIKIDVLDQKEEYVHDEGVQFMKVAVKGNYTKTINGKPESFIENEIIILESVAGKWKVTEEMNPWG